MALLTETTNGTRPVPTKLSAIRSVGAATITVDALTGWPIVGKQVHFIEYAVDTSNNKIPGSQTDWKGTVTGATSIGSLVLKAGTDNGGAVGYVIEAAPTAAWADDLYEWGTTHADEDGVLLPAAVQAALGITSTPAGGWDLLNAGVGPNTVTYNGNHSYDLVFNGINLTTAVSAGMRFRTTRTVAAPTQSTSLNGTSQYFSKTSPAGMTFTDDFVAGAWVKLSSYPVGGLGVIMSRFNGTNGWAMVVTETGILSLSGCNAGAANFKQVVSYQSIPLNKWVHVVAQLDMSESGASTTTSYMMIDGVDVPVVKAASGTSPVALIQGGNLEVGTRNGGTNFFPGKIAQAFVPSAKITQANIRTLYSQGLTPALITANSIVSAYSLSNSLNDINTTNANNLTANGGAVTTNADSPFGGQADGTISSTLDYAIVQKTSFSTNTTVTVQVPEGCTIPTSGGVANVYYSNVKVPYNFPGQRGKWSVEMVCSGGQQNTPTAGTWYNLGSQKLNVPVGSWELGYSTLMGADYSGATNPRHAISLSTSTTAATDSELTSGNGSNGVGFLLTPAAKSRNRDISAATDYYLISLTNTATSTAIYNFGSLVSTAPALSIISAQNAYL